MLTNGFRLAAALACACSAQSYAINRCVDGQGKVTYTDAPCSGGQAVSTVEIRGNPAKSARADQDQSGSSATADGPPPAPSEQPPSATASMNRWLAERDKENQRHEIEKQIKQLESDNADCRDGMDRRLAILQSKKSLANNNLAGAMYEASISQEMEAVTASYATKIKDNDSKLAALRSQLALIQ